MDKGVLTRCGYRCDLCLAYRPNIEKNDRRQLLSDGWHRYFGFRIPSADIICDGCMSSDNPRLIDKNCPVRPCVIAKGLENCANCKEYVCDKLKERIVDPAEVKRRYGRPIPEKDYELFIKPYASRERLDKIRDESK